MNIKLGAVCALLGLAFLSACSTLNEHENTARLTTQYATIKVIDGDVGRAERVEDIASDVRAYASSEAHLTVDLLIGAIRDRIDWGDLDAADTLLLTTLIDELRAELMRRLGPGVLPEDLRLAADTVAEWVIAAARMT